MTWEAGWRYGIISTVHYEQQKIYRQIILFQRIYRRFNAIVSQLKMHYFSEGAFESLIASQLLKKEKYI